jgi:prolipoprotein diacylglyceryltransferase
MPDPYFTFGLWTMRTYTLALALGILASAGLGIFRLRRRFPPGRVADCYLGGLIGGVILARVFHVALNWNYFVDNLAEARHIDAGGLDWHGAVIGTLIGIALVARWRKIDFRDLIDSLTPALPLLALAGWFGCWAASCTYGAEVESLADYPALFAWEGPDIYGIYDPRFNVQALGALFGLALLAFAMLTLLLRPLTGTRFWFILGMLGAGMFGLGFLRGDYAVFAAGLRLDQWLDALMIGLALAVILAKGVGGLRRVKRDTGQVAA